MDGVLQRKLTTGKETTRTVVFNEQLAEGETLSVISTPYVSKEALAALGNPAEIFITVSTEPLDLEKLSS